MPADQNLLQEQVVQTLDRNILLLAPAGTGKTDTLARRIANVLNQGIATADQILCLTFTNRACKEIQERVLGMATSQARQVSVRTFHSFCCEVIRQEAKRETDIPAEFLIFDEIDCLELIKTLIQNQDSASTLQDFIELVKSNRIGSSEKTIPQIIQELSLRPLDPIRRICSSNQGQFDRELYGNLINFGDKLVRKYDQSLREQGALDFNDLQIEAYRLFEIAEIAERWTARYRFIHIDEVQDTSLAEYAILSKIFPRSRILICGDYFQTIYQWRGSNPENVFDWFLENYAPVRISFQKNYRATATLLRATHGYLLNAFPSATLERFHTPELEIFSPTPGDPIEIAGFKDLQDEAHWIYDRIYQQIHQQTNLRVAVLTRTNRMNATLSDFFQAFNQSQPESRRLNFFTVEEFKFFRRQEIKDLLAYLKLIVNKYDDQSLQRILKRFFPTSGSRAVTLSKKAEYRQAGLRLIDLIDPVTDQYGEPYSQLISALDDNRVVVFDVETNGRDFLRSEIIQIAAIKIDAEGREFDRFERYLKIGGSVGLTEFIHGISDDHLAANGQPPHLVLSEFAEFIRGCHIVGHNVQFDIDMFRSQLIRYQLPLDQPITFDDTANIGRRFLPGLKNYKLETLCQHYQTETRSDHNALNDVLATGEILVKLIQHHLRPNEEQRRRLLAPFAGKFETLSRQLETLRNPADNCRPLERLDQIIEFSNIRQVYRSEEHRWENIQEFRRIVTAFDRPEQHGFHSIRDLLQITALSNTELDRLTATHANTATGHPRIPIITVHQAKGAEFDWVFLAGVHASGYPSFHSLREGREQEERRLFYVAMTRARQKLSISWSQSQWIDAESPYLELIPADVVQRLDIGLDNGLDNGLDTEA
jgi:DNA helicase-2/ATP-dependent DNA helicase PcrA